MANKKLEVNVQHIIKDIEAGKFTSFQSILNETGGQHIYEAVNEELRKYLKENNAVMISATQLAHLRETGYKDFESERKALETQLKTATGDLKKQIEGKLKDLKKFQYYSERKAPIGDELHKILELTDKGLVDLNDAVKAANQIMQQMQVDPHTNEKLKSLVGKTSTDTMKNFRRAIKNAQDFQKMKVSAGMIGGETETARSMAFKKDGKLYVVSGSTDWTKAKEGKIGDYKTTASFSAMHNLIQSVVNATLIRAQEGASLPITSKVAHLPITAGRMKYSNTLPGVYDINVGSYQEGVKLISDLIDVLEGRKSFTDVKIPGSVRGVAEKGPFTYKNEVREAMYYNGKPIGQWIGQTVEEVKSLLDSLQPQQRQQFLGNLFGQTDGKPWYNTENAKLLKEAFRGMYQPAQKDFKTYGGMSLSTLSSKFASGEITKEALISAIKEGTKTQIDTEELASRLFFGEDKYYSEVFVKAIKEAIPEISNKISDIFDRELDKTMAGYLSGLSEDEKPKPSKYDMYAPDVWELEEKRQQAWIESGVERMKLGYTDKPLFDDKGIKTLADRMTRLVDFYQRTTNIFNKVAEDINKELPADTQPYTGEELARTYLARKSPEVYDRYMRSKGLYESFTTEAQGLPLEEQVQWIRKQLDTFIAEEGNLLNTFDTFAEIADQKSKDVFSKEFARKISYVGAPGGYIAPGTLYGLLMGSTFGVAQEGQMSEFDKLRGKDIYGRTLSAEAIDRLTESQVDNDISKIDFYKQKLSEMTEELGVSAEKIGIFSDYLDRVQKVADQAGIELEQVLEGVDEKGFIKEGSLLDKQLRAINEMPAESLYLPTSGKHGISGKARESLFGLFDDTGMESLATQYDIYLDEQDNKRKEELKKQNGIRVQKEQEFTKLVDTELENRLKFLYAETAMPDYIKAQEDAERNEDMMGLSPEMFKSITDGKQKGLHIGDSIRETTQKINDLNQANKNLLSATQREADLRQKWYTVNWQPVGAGINGANYQYYYNSAGDILKVQATSSEVADLSKTKPTSITTDFEGKTIGKTYKYLNDKVFADYGPGGLQAWVEKWKKGDIQAAQAELIGILTKVPSYKKSSGGLSKAGRTAMDEILTDTFGAKYQPQQGLGAILNETKGIHQDTTDIKNLLSPIFGGGTTNTFGAAYKNLNWVAFQKWAETTNGVDNEAPTMPKGQEKPKKENTQAEIDKQQKQDIRAYQQYINKVISLESQIDKLQKQAALSSGKHKEAIYGTIDALNDELGDLNRNNDTLVKRVATEQAATKASIDATAALKKQSNEQKNLVSVKGATSIWDMMANDIRRATMRIADFGVAAKVLNKIPQDIQKIIQYTKELDLAMTNIRIVGGYTEEQTKDLMRSYSELGKTLSATTTEVATAANEWLRQGYEAESQLEALISASTKLSKLGMISASEATTALTAALKSFNLAAEDAIDVVDKLTKVDQLAAVSAGGIATAMQKSATSAKLAGMSMDELIGSVSVIGEVTQQSMDTVGNAMKSILSRYGNVKASVYTQMGLNDDGETSENINDIEKVLSKLGIKMRSTSSEMRDITDVLDEVNEGWGTYDTVTKNALATAFGGTRMRENFLVLMENWDRVKELTEESANAAGTADEKYSAYTDSIEAGLKRVQNAWEDISQKFENSWLIKTGIGITEFFVSNLDKITKYITIIAATKFSNKIFEFGANSIKGIPNVIGKLKGLFNVSSSGDVSYDENGNMILNKQEGEGTSWSKFGTKSIIESLDKNIGNTNSILNEIKGRIGVETASGQNSGVMASSLTGYSGQTWWKGTAKRVMVNGRTYYRDRQGKYVTEIGELLDPSQQKDVDELNEELEKQRNSARVKAGITAGVSAALTNALTTKQVGGDKIGKLITGSDISVEETTEDKIIRTGMSGILAGVGGYFAGPIGAAIGQSVGEAGASVISTIVHRSEIEMKQRIADAKEELNSLNNLQTTVENIQLNDEDDNKELIESVRTLFNNDNLSDLQDSVLKSINEASLGDEVSNLTDIVELIKDNNTEQNKQILKILKEENLKEKIQATYESTEDVRSSAYKIVGSIKSNFGYIVEGLESNLSDLSKQIDESSLNKIIASYNKITNSVTSEEIMKNVTNFYDAIKDIGTTFNTSEIGDLIDDYNEYRETMFDTLSEYGLQKSGLLDLSGYELENIGLSGAITRISKLLEEKGYGDFIDNTGKVYSDIYESIYSELKDSDIYSSLQYGVSAIKDLDLSTEKGEERLEQFAEAFGVTYEEALSLRKEFGDLSTTMAYMTPDEVMEYYDNLSNIFNDLAENTAVSAENIKTILTDSNYSSLLPYLLQGNDELQNALYKRLLSGEQDLVYGKALFSSLMSNTNIFEAFTNNLDENLKTDISKRGYSSFQSIITAVQEGSLSEDSEIVKKAKESIESWNVEYKRDLEGTNKLLSYQTQYLDRQIDNLEEQKDALSNINDEREKEVNLIKARNALENAKKERKRVYRQGIGFVYESDEEAIKEAQDNLEELETENRQEALQYQIDLLQQQKNILDNLPDEEEFEQLSKIYSQWAGTGEGSLDSVTQATVALVNKYKDSVTTLDTYNEFIKSLTQKENDTENIKNEDDQSELTITSGSIISGTSASGLGRSFWDFDWGSDDVQITYKGKNYNIRSTEGGFDKNAVAESYYNDANKNPSDGEVYKYNGDYYLYHKGSGWEKILDRYDGTDLMKAFENAGYASGTTAFSGGGVLINELGTEAVITPGGTLTALPSKSGIVPADITRNVWALGEVAPTLVAQLSSLSQKAFTGNAGNTTYEEGQYFDNFTMNVYPEKGDDFSRILEQARAKMRLTRHSN